MAALSGKTVIVTGASRGLGRSIAALFAENGATVIATARDEDALQQLAETFSGSGTIVAYPCDISIGTQVQSFIQFVLERFNQLDILINNAGIGIMGPVHELAEAEWDNMMGVNLKGPYLTCKNAIPHFIERQAGHIINISSVAGTVTFKGGGGYCASKFGLMALTDVLTQELKPYKVKVSVICPGSIQTDFFGAESPSYALQPKQVAKVALDMATAPDGVILNQVVMRPQVPPELQS